MEKNPKYFTCGDCGNIAEYNDELICPCSVPDIENKESEDDGVE